MSDPLPEEFPYLVVGLSLAGVAAALELASLGQTVCLVGGHIQGGWLREFFEITPTPLNSQPVSGEQFEELATTELLRAGVQIEDRFWPEKLERGESGVNLRFDTGERDLRTKALLYAPNSLQLEPPEVINAAQSYWNRSISWSVACELGCKILGGQAVVVLGCGNFALEQALLATAEAATVTLVCVEAELHDPAGLRGRAVAAGVKFRTGISVQRVLGTEEKGATGILVTAQGQEERIGFSRLFVAGERECPWEIQDGSWRDAGEWLQPMGIAAGILDWDHLALWRDGIRAARAAVSAPRHEA